MKHLGFILKMITYAICPSFMKIISILFYYLKYKIFAVYFSI